MDLRHGKHLRPAQIGSSSSSLSVLEGSDEQVKFQMRNYGDTQSRAMIGIRKGIER